MSDIGNLPLTKAEDVIQYLAQTNDELYNWNKLSEELFELGEVAMKMSNKNGTEKQPPMEKFIEEAGDVVLRIDLLGKKYGVLDDIMDRINDKLENKFAGYINENKYIGRI